MDLKHYAFSSQLLLSLTERKESFLNEVDSEYASNYSGTVFALTEMDPLKSRRSFCVSSSSQLFRSEETLDLLIKKAGTPGIPSWLERALDERRVFSLNTSWPGWEDVLSAKPVVKKKVISLAGLGDVGGILCSGLRLLGSENISKIKIFDMDVNKLVRWELECNSILPPENNLSYPEVVRTTAEDVFNCDVFVFCVSVGVPSIGKEETDVRLAQLKGNSAIISHYARLARNSGYKGLFAVVSDPVDMLCKAAFLESNKDENGVLDFLGLAPEQIKGYGLGVMYARAAYYSKDLGISESFLREGRAFGPHGQGLVIADSVENYEAAASDYLTSKAAASNLEVRSAGFKPFIAPALSSGSLSLIATIKGGWHYSSNFIGGVYMGSRNRELDAGIEFETQSMPPQLYKKITETYNYLRDYI
jgi:hypothetical protein